MKYLSFITVCSVIVCWIVIHPVLPLFWSHRCCRHGSSSWLWYLRLQVSRTNEHIALPDEAESVGSVRHCGGHCSRSCLHLIKEINHCISLFHSQIRRIRDISLILNWDYQCNSVSYLFQVFVILYVYVHCIEHKCGSSFDRVCMYT